MSALTAAPTEDRVAQARLRDWINTEGFAIRRELRSMTVDNQTLELQMATLVADADHAKTEIERNWRAVHWGTDPERRWAWRVDARYDPHPGSAIAPTTAHEDRARARRRVLTRPVWRARLKSGALARASQ